MSFTLVNKNCVEYICDLKKTGKKEIFDAIITDPPYNISKKNNFKTIGRSGIDFGLWDYGFDQTTWIKETAPLLKKGGSLILFNDYKNFGEIAKILTELDFEVKDVIRWIKSNPMPRNTSRRYVTDYEFALWSTKTGDKWTFNKPKDKKYIRPEFNFPIVASGKDKIHPTQKSKNLMNEIIKIHTDPGDLIFDPFMGSGTTGVCCLQNQRLFVGCEIDKKYFSFAEERMNQENIKNIVQRKVIRSPLYYLGDKYKLLPQIINFFPKKINTFYDVFGGGGTMLSNVSAKEHIYNDIDENVSSLVEFLSKTNFKEISKYIYIYIQKYNLTAGNKKNKTKNKNNYERLKQDFNLKIKNNSFEEKIMLLCLIIFGFNSQIRFNSKKEFNIPIGKQDFNANRIFNLKKFSSSLKNKKISFFSRDFSFIYDLICNGKISSDDFMYFDPPYSITSATYNEKWEKNDDKRLFDLLDTLTEKRIKWALSNIVESKGKINIDLKNWSKKYYVNNLNYSYSHSNYQRKKGETDQEILVTNYVE